MNKTLKFLCGLMIALSVGFCGIGGYFILNNSMGAGLLGLGCGLLGIGMVIFMGDGVVYQSSDAVEQNATEARPKLRRVKDIDKSAVAPVKKSAAKTKKNTDVPEGIFDGSITKVGNDTELAEPCSIVLYPASLKLVFGKSDIQLNIPDIQSISQDKQTVRMKCTVDGVVETYQIAFTSVLKAKAVVQTLQFKMKGV